MPSDSLERAATTDLAQHIRHTVFKNYKQNRESLETRWHRNRAAAEVDLEFDDHGVWKKDERAEDWQSDTMFDTVRQKIVAAKAIISDTAFKGHRVQFMLVPPEGHEDMGDEVAENERDAVVKANESYIRRQLDNCDAVVEFGKCVLSGATYGRYFAKRYTTEMTEDGYEPIAENVFIPASTSRKTRGIEYKSPWNIYWDMESPDPMHEGEAILEHDYVSAATLRRDKNKPLHMEKFIMEAIKDNKTHQDSEVSDDTTVLPTRLRDVKERRRTISKLEFWGRVPRRKVEAFEKMLAENGMVESPADRDHDDPEDEMGDEVEIFAILAGDHVIAYQRLEGTHQRPYYMGDWEEVLDGNCGRSIADNLNYVMVVLNGAIRTLEDNMKQASKLILALKRSLMSEDFEQELASDKRVIALTMDEESLQGVKDAVQQIKIDAMMEELSAIITLFLEFADMSSSIPRAEQGQQSVNPQTAFELQQRLERSGKYMGEVMKRLDVFIEAVINDFYRYNMLDPDLPVTKGIFKVKALGFSSFENRVIRLQKLMQFFALIVDRPEVLAEIDMRWLVEEIAKGMDIEPEQLFKSDEQKQAEAEAQANGPDAQAQALAIEGAQLQNAKTQSDMEKTQSDIDKNEHDKAVDEEKLKIEKAKTVGDLRVKMKQADQKAAKPEGQSQ